MDIKALIEKIIKRFFIIIFYILRVFPIKKDKIVFSNFNGKGYGDNPKYIAEVLRKKTNYKLIWLCDNINENFPDEIQPVKRFSLKGFYALITSKVWVDNSRKGYYVRKRKKQYYIQTWHGGEGLKKCEKDAIENLSANWIKASKNDSSMIDFAISNSTFNTDLYRRAFWYNGEILEYGSPRNDILYQFDKHREIKEKIYEQFNIQGRCKLILYAPTFRDNKDYSVYNMDYEKVIQEFENYYSEKCILITRLHPKMNPHKFKISYCKNIIDVSNYPDLYEILIASDIMISDYSSCMFEMGYLRKPVFIYANDYDYYGSTRGFLFNIKELPYIFTDNNENLIRNIKKFDMDDYQRKLLNFNKSLGIITTGNGSEKVARLIIDIINKK